MLRRLSILLVAVAPLTAGASEAERLSLPRWFLGAEGGAMVPVGGWAGGEAPEGPPDGAPRFSLGGGGRVKAGWAPRQTRFFAVELEAGYAQLASTGRADAVPEAAAARLWSASVGGIVDMPGRGFSRVAFELHGALGVLVPDGEDLLEGREVPYDFLETTLFGRAGARFVYRATDRLEAVAGADFLMAPGGVDHAEQEPRSIMALEPSVSVRYWFGR